MGLSVTASSSSRKLPKRAAQQVEIPRQAVRVLAHLGVVVGDDEQLGEREGDPLAELVRSLDSLGEEGLPHQPGRRLLAGRRQQLVIGGEMRDRGQRHLLVEPARETFLLQGLHLAGARPVGRLEEEAGGVLLGGAPGGRAGGAGGGVKVWLPLDWRKNPLISPAGNAAVWRLR